MAAWGVVLRLEYQHQIHSRIPLQIDKQIFVKLTLNKEISLVSYSRWQRLHHLLTLTHAFLLLKTHCAVFKNIACSKTTKLYWRLVECFLFDTQYINQFTQKLKYNKTIDLIFWRVFLLPFRNELTFPSNIVFPDVRCVPSFPAAPVTSPTFFHSPLVESH